MAQAHVRRISGPLLLVHVGEGLASVVHDLVGVHDDVVEGGVDLDLCLGTIAVADLPLLIPISDVLGEELWVDGVDDLGKG